MPCVVCITPVKSPAKDELIKILFLLEVESQVSGENGMLHHLHKGIVLSSREIVKNIGALLMKQKNKVGILITG